MLGAIAGDIIGSTYEFKRNNIKTTDFPLFSERARFTDDTVMTFAIASALMESIPVRRGVPEMSAFADCVIDSMHKFGHAYPYAGYGSKFVIWLSNRERQPYGSFGNGSAMRVSPVAWAFDATCQGSVPEAITAFLEGESYEDTVRKAVSLGGDSDTIACIAGGIAESFYNGVPEEIMRGTFERLDENLRDVFSQWCNWMTGGSD